MPSPKIHQVVRRPGTLGNPRKFPGEMGGGYALTTADSLLTLETARNNANVTHGIANAWTLMLWTCPANSSSTATEVYFNLKNTANVNDEILLQVLGATANDPTNIIIRDSAGATIKDYLYDSRITSKDNAIACWVFTWDGTTLTYYEDGVVVAVTTATTDTTGTMANSARATAVSGTVAGATARQASVPCIAMWNTALSATEVKSLQCEGFGANANLNVAFDEYSSAASLVHWWRPGTDLNATASANGKDWADGPAASRLNVYETTTGVLTSYSNINTGAPRPLNAAYYDLITNEMFANVAQQTIGVTNVMTWLCYYRWVASNNGTVPIFDISPSSGSINKIMVSMNEAVANDPLEIQIFDSSGVIIKKWTWDRGTHPAAATVNPGGLLLGFSWDGPANSLKAWINGRDIGPATTLTNDVNSSARGDGNCGIYIGSNAAGVFQTGRFSTLACWNKILTTTEHATIWNEGFPMLVDLSKDTLGYYGASNLKHWWRLTRQPGTVYNVGTSLTTDYVKTGGINVETGAANITFAADRFNITAGVGVGSSVFFSGANTSMASSTQTMNIANAWSIQYTHRPSAVATDQNVIQIGAAGAANTIVIKFVNAGTDYLNILLYDSAGVLFKDYQYNTPWTANAWNPVTVTWDGTTLVYYRLGTATAANVKTTDLAGTMTDTARAVYVGASDTGTNYVADLHRMAQFACWNTVLTANEASVLARSLFGKCVDLRVNGTTYASSGSLKHWWKLGSDPNNWGKDYVGGVDLIPNTAMQALAAHGIQAFSEFF